MGSLVGLSGRGPTPCSAALLPAAPAAEHAACLATPAQQACVALACLRLNSVLVCLQVAVADH